MRTEQGGTRLFCPNCRKITVCSSVSGRDVGRRVRKGRPETHYYRRWRECLTCDRKFSTAEIDDSFLEKMFKAVEIIARSGKAFKDTGKMNRIYEAVVELESALGGPLNQIKEALGSIDTKLKECSKVDDDLLTVKNLFDNMCEAAKAFETR